MPDVARLRRKILSAVTMVDEPAVIALLELSDADPGDSLSSMKDRGEILRFEVDGRVTYPLFQFDADGHRVLPSLSAVLAERPPGWSDYRLLHWLVTPHLDLGCIPAQSIRTDTDAVLAAFRREIESPCHS